MRRLNASIFFFLVACIGLLLHAQVKAQEEIFPDQTMGQLPVPTWKPDRPEDSDPEISLVFNNLPILEVLEQFKVETGLDVRLGDKILATRNVTVRIKRERAKQSLESIATSIGAIVKYDSLTAVYSLVVKKDDTNELEHKELERQINEAFPDSFVQLSKIGNQLLVKGQAKDFVEANQILKLIATFMPQPEKADEPIANNQMYNSNGFGSPGGLGSLDNLRNSFSTRNTTKNVINLLTVPGSQQVMLRVTVAEVNRSAARSIGLNFLVRNGDDNLFRSALGSSGTDSGTFFDGDLAGGTIQALIDSSDVGLAIDALRDMNLAKTLSEPNLTTIHGQRAEFHAGGRFPVPVISGLNNAGTQGVEFVPFGVGLEFVPFILQRDRIRLVMTAEVSSRNERIGSSIGGVDGTAVAGLDSRKFSTTVELKPGQTLAVAGLIQNTLTGNVKRIPGIEDIPLIGRAAASDLVSSTETELVILVTPEFVQPISNKTRIPLPGHQVFEPNDYEFFVGGLMESQYSENFRSPARTDKFRRRAYYQCEKRFIIGDSGYSNTCPAASSPHSSVNVVGR